MRLPSLLLPAIPMNAMVVLGASVGIVFLGSRLLKRMQFAGKDEQVGRDGDAVRMACNTLSGGKAAASSCMLTAGTHASIHASCALHAMPL